MNENKTCYFGFDGTNEKVMGKCGYDTKPHMCKWATELIHDGKPKTECEYYGKAIPEWQR